MDEKIPNDDLLTQLLRKAWPSSTCPPADRWLEVLEHRLDGSEAERLNAHADTCPACASERKLCAAFFADAEDAAASNEDVDFVVERLRATRAAAKDNVVPLPQNRWRVAQPLLGLAAAAALVLAILPLVGPLFTGGPELPDRGESSLVRGSTVALVSPVGDLRGPPEEFRWQRVENASRYRVIVREVDDNILWQQTVAPTDRLAVPGELAERLFAAVVYTWQVEAINDAGDRIAASEPTAFRLLPGSPQ